MLESLRGMLGTRGSLGGGAGAVVPWRVDDDTPRRVWGGVECKCCGVPWRVDGHQGGLGWGKMPGSLWGVHGQEAALAHGHLGPQG